MAQPIISWYNADDSICANWDAGIVDADSYSDVKEVYIWNNRGPIGTAVSDATNVFITTKNTDGTDTGPVATKSSAVVEVATFDGANWSSWQEVGGSSSTVTLVNSSGETGVLRGNANNGDKNDTNAKKNYARVRLRLHVKPEAPAGPISWKTRVSYQYI